MSNYKPLVYNDVDEDLYFFKPFGKCVKRSASWEPRLRSDLIHWNESLDSPELERDFCMGDQADDSTRRSVLSIIRSNWDSFCERGVSRPVIDFEFCIGTGDSPPVCCRQSKYGYHERKIMNTHIQALDNSGLITDCTGSWGSLLFLAPKHHQEDCNDVKDFIWRLCVSYQPLNGITRSFEFPIPRCADSIEELGDSCVILFIISLDARSGYHQISVHKRDQKNLAFFTPDVKKKTYRVMPFGPKNAPEFYTAMMQILRDDWIALFNETRHGIVDENAPKTIVCDDKIFINDILLYSNHTPTLLH